MKIGVIGGGPAGITCAYQLAKKNLQVDIYEAEPIIGGMAKTIELWGQRVDLGPHRFFSNNSRANQLWLEVVGHDYEIIQRLTRIYYKGKFFIYPLKPFDVLSKLGLLETGHCLASYLKEKALPKKDDDSFESWVVQRFGRRLFEVFFKSYSEKVWGISCGELAADFASQRIMKFSLSEAVRKAIFNSKTRHKTLVEKFSYPHGGTGSVYERMARSVQIRGGKIYCNSPVRRVLRDGAEIIGLETAAGQKVHFDKVVSTMPLPQLVEGLDGTPLEVVESARTLIFRNTIIVYLLIDCEALFPDNWLYIHSPDLLMGRVTNFRNWIGQLHNDKQETILAIEYWCFDDDYVWRTTDENLISIATKEIKKTGLLHTGNILSGYVYRVKKSYPIYQRNYKSQLTCIKNYLDTISDLTIIGRGGAFKYNNQDHSILMGILAAENITGEAKHDLWEINHDSEYHEA